MDWLAGNMEDALRYVAERRLAARLVKRADIADAIGQAQNARQELGILGANPEELNNSLLGLQQGELTPSQATRGIRHAVPGIGEQLANIPAGIGTATSQGRPLDALAQADVLGLKNLVPGSEHFDPTTAMMAAGLGGTTAALQSQYHHNQRLNQALHFSGPGEKDPLSSLVKSQYGKHAPEQLNTWRRSNVPPESLLDAYRGGGVKGIGSELRRRFLGPAAETEMPRIMVGVKGKLVPMNKFNLPRRAIAGAAEKLEAAGHTAGRLARFGLPAAAASLPLLYREWLGRGYRSGRQPAQDLIEANQTLAPTQR